MNNNKHKSIKRNPLIALVNGLKTINQRLCVLACIILYSTLMCSIANADPLVTNVATANYSINGTSHQASATAQFPMDTVVAPSDVITIAKQANADEAFVGNTVTYSLTITNSNDHEQTNIVVVDNLPSNVSYLSGSAIINDSTLNNNQVLLLGNQLTFNLDNIPANTVWVLKYSVKVNASGVATNTATVSSDTATSTQATSTIDVTERTPSTIKFMKISDVGVSSIIPTTAYNNDQNGGKQWQSVDTVTLSDGSTVNLPTPQPIIDANQFSLLDPIVIEVRDLDQNLNSSEIDTIIVEVVVPDTGDKEILLLQETGLNTGVFRGVLLTTSNSADIQNGLLSLQNGSEINVLYNDDIENSGIFKADALVVPNSEIVLSKTADKTSASIGELVKYSLAFTNTTGTAITNLNIVDTLPLGFRYLPNTARLNGVFLNSGITVNGRNLNFALGNMPTGQKWTLEYLTNISAGVQIGEAINTAYIKGNNTQSDKAHATVDIEDDLMRTKNILTGRVYIGCKTGKDSETLKDARIFTETGRSVLSDEEGFWHMEGIQPGTHVLQIDKESLPAGYAPVLCEEDTRFAKNPTSQFIDLQAGVLWHTDFYVAKILPDNFKNTSQKALSANGNNKTQRKSYSEPNPKDIYGAKYLETATKDFEILWPKNNYVPPVASTKIFIKAPYKTKVDVFLNGEKVSPLNYDGSSTNKAQTTTIRRWKGVDINTKNINNTLLVINKDASGKEIGRKTHNIHFSGEATTAEFVEEESNLIADGKTIPVIALLPRDKDGYRLRTGSHGYFNIENNAFKVKTFNAIDDSRDLNESLAGYYKYHVDGDGIARISLNPTTQSGKVELNLKFPDGKSKTIKAWLKPQLRDWILVGLAEGTIAHNTLSGNMVSLTDLDKSDSLTKSGRISFYAQGKVKGKYLLTAAYDTHKADQEVGSQLNGNIDPDAWYTIYGDNSNSQYNAPSSRKLYLKIEKENFYALFGDFNTSMHITELAQYDRVLNGIKSEFNGERFSYNTFISETSNKHQHEEIPGDGTSGLYHLSADIVPNSETIKLETRDRFHSERIIESRVLTRYQDYQIDYATGALFFKFPISGRDGSFNPQLIVIDYDSEDDDNKEIVMGGRVAVKTDNKKLEVGLSAIHINKESSENDTLVAADATYKITPDTTLKVEVAQSKTEASQYQSTNAEIIELEKQIQDMEAKLYYRKQDDNFGINEQASEVATKKLGASINYKINDKTQIDAEVSRQKNLDDGNQRDLAEVGVTHKRNQLELNAGLRHSKEKLTSETATNNTAILGARYTTNNGRVTYRASIEENISASSIEERSPNRKLVGVDVKINNDMSVFAEHELTDNDSVKTQNSRIGVSKSLWKGAKAKSTFTKERTDQSQRDYATLGLSQRIKIAKDLSADISIDHAKTISGTQERFNDDEPENQGSQSDDYTAFSVGLGQQFEDWSWTSRAEYRDGEQYDKANLQLGLIHQIKNGKQLSARLTHTETDNIDGNFDRNTKLSFGSAWHPQEKDFVFFNRLDLVDEKSTTVDNGASSNSHTQKIIHNMHYNRKFNNQKTQIGLHHGVKHVIDASNSDKSEATIDTASVQLRHDITKKVDIGARVGYLRDWNSDALETTAGVSVGLTPMTNAWVELGYNFEGFEDEDFDDSSFKRKGPYASFRYKFDQDSFGGKDLPVRNVPIKGEVKKEKNIKAEKKVKASVVNAKKDNSNKELKTKKIPSTSSNSNSIENAEMMETMFSR